jgi:hypothetical protein
VETAPGSRYRNLSQGAVTVVPDTARELLARFDARSAHYEVRERHSGSA